LIENYSSTKYLIFASSQFIFRKLFHKIFVVEIKTITNRASAGNKFYKDNLNKSPSIDDKNQCF
jgi:hypothetical protein